jgi:hypothetical protein
MLTSDMCLLAETGGATACNNQYLSQHDISSKQQPAECSHGVAALALMLLCSQAAGRG